MDAAGTPREVRFDKVNPATASMARVERPHGHGGGKGASEILLIESKRILSVDSRLLNQIRTQCHKILDVVEGRTAAVPVVFTPTLPKTVVPKTLQKKETTKKKAITKKEEKPKSPKGKNVIREKTPEPNYISTLVLC